MFFKFINHQILIYQIKDGKYNSEFNAKNYVLIQLIEQ